VCHVKPSTLARLTPPHASAVLEPSASAPQALMHACSNTSTARASVRAPHARALRRSSRMQVAAQSAAQDSTDFVPGNSNSRQVHVYEEKDEYSRYVCIDAACRAMREDVYNVSVRCKASRVKTDGDCAFSCKHRFDVLEEYHVNFPASYAYDPQSKVAAPGRYRVTLPKGYDAKRAEPYPCVVCVPGEAGFGPRDGKASLSASIAKTKWNDECQVILIEVVFNTPTWLNDSATSNHESYLMKVVLPHFRAAHNVGSMSLLGYGTGGYGALTTLLRYPLTFDRVVAADAPVLAGYKSIEREWGAEPLERGARWGSFDVAFPNDSDYAPYAAGHLVEDPWTLEQLNSHPRARVALLPGNKTRVELEDFAEHLADCGVAHDVLAGFEADDIGREGAWIAAAVKWLSQ